MGRQKQHYITRAITSPWEVAEEPGRKLWVADLVSGRPPELKRSDLAFSGHRLWDQKYEPFFNEVFETDFIQQRERIIRGDGDGDGSVKLDRRYYRAAYKMIAIHLLRTREYQEGTRGLDLILEGMTPENFDEVADKLSESNAIIRVPVIESSLAVPDTFVFPVPCGFITENKHYYYDVARAFPIHPKLALVLAPYNFRMDFIREVLSPGHALLEYSMGISRKVQQIALPPDLPPQADPALMENIALARQKNVARFQTIIKAKQQSPTATPELDNYFSVPLSNSGD